MNTKSNSVYRVHNDWSVALFGSRPVEMWYRSRIAAEAAAAERGRDLEVEEYTPEDFKYISIHARPLICCDDTPETCDLLECPPVRIVTI